MTKTSQKDLAALVALMRENKVLQVKTGALEVVLHPEAFVVLPQAPAPEARTKRAKPEADAPIAPTPDTDPTLFSHLS